MVDSQSAFETVVEYAPDGREIRYVPSRGVYLVQPDDDNYWIECETLADARDAYWNPDEDR